MRIILEKITLVTTNYEPNKQKELLEFSESILSTLFNPANRNKLEFIWLFSIIERLAQNYLLKNLDNLKDELIILREKMTKKNSDNAKEFINNLNNTIQIIDKIKNGISKPDLGTFLYIIEFIIYNWPADIVDSIITLLILKKFVNIRNDIIHGKILPPRFKHVAIAFSMFIMVINIFLLIENKDLILFDL